jgi:flagellar assembly factor FliW
MLVNTTRFGPIEIAADDLLTFSEGLLGFNDLEKFVLLDDPNDEIFAWLQSCDEPSIAFPVLEPELFEENYQLEMTKSDLETLQAKDTSELRSFCIITIPEDPARMTANLKAPVIVNISQRLARQCVLQNNKLEIREPIFTKLQQRVVTQTPASIKSQVAEWGVAVRLPQEKPKREPEAGF